MGIGMGGTKVQVLVGTKLCTYKKSIKSHSIKRFCADFSLLVLYRCIGLIVHWSMQSFPFFV